jgi:deazaflavin-dependent oxidoreductase (nitroreductase family)
MTKNQGRALPTGFMRWFFRAPIWLYRWRLGWLLGERMLLLEHIGRKSGQKRHAVLEVVRYDRASSTIVIVSGFGEKSQWLQNVLHNPNVTVTLGRRQMAMRATRLDEADAAAELVDYAARHPQSMRILSDRLGYDYDGSADSLHALAAQLPVIRLDLA